MCDCFHLAFPNWHAASSGTGGRRLRGPEPGTEDDSICDESSQFAEGERPRPQGSSPVEEYPETEKYTDSDKECEAEHDPHHKSGTGKKTKKSGLGSMFEKRSTPKMSKLKEIPSPESGVIVKTAKDGCAEGLVYTGGGKDGIFIKEVVPESPASKSLKLKEGDQILSATVYFDNMSYEDAIQILEHAQAYKVKLCLKRKPDITETEPTIESDAIPEEEVYSPEMRESGKTKRRGDARISWPKFPSFGKGRKSRFTRSHSSSEADEQRKLELSPTTSDTESPIKSQDALKGKKKNKAKLSLLTKRGRISSSEDQDTDTPTTGQISGKILQTHETSDMLSPEGLESPSGEKPEVYVTEDLKVAENLRLEQKDQKLTEPQTVQHKVELISVDSTLKTADLTVALADKESSSGIKSPDGKKKKKERSELKMKILGKDKSHKKDAKAKSSPKRLKTLGASIEIPDQPENEKSDVIPGFESHTKLQDEQLALNASTQITVTTEKQMSVPKVELDIPDAELIRKSPQKGDKKHKKGKDIKEKQETKTGPTFKLPNIDLSGIATEQTVQKMNVNVEEHTTKIEHLTTEGAEMKEDPYEQLSKRTQLPKREEIEIPGMEDMSMRITAKGHKEPKAGFMGDYEELQAETVQLSIDVDSVKEAVSKLPGYKLPRLDTSGVPIPEEITVIDANAQRISVKTPTKVVDTKTKHEAHFSEFGITASQEISKTTVKLPKITPADLTSEELLIETKVDLKTPEKKYKTKSKQSDEEIKSELYKREVIIIPGKESAQDGAILQTQDTVGIKYEYESAAKLSPKKSDKISKKAKITTPSFGIAKPDIKIPDIGIDLSKQKGDTVKGERTILIQEELLKTETRKGRGEIGGVIPDVKIPEIDGIEYIDSVGGSPTKRDGGIGLKGFGVNLDAATTNVDISIPEIRGEVKDVKAEEHTIKLPKFGADAVDISVNVPDADKSINIDGAEIKTLEREGKGSKFKMPNLDISMPKVKGPKIDLSLSKKDVDVTLPEAEAVVKLPEVPEVDVTRGNVDVSIPEQKMKVGKPELEIKPLTAEGELDGQGDKFKMPKFGIKMPKIKGPEFDLSLSKKDVNVTLPHAKAVGKLPEAPEVDVTLGSVDVAIPEGKVEVKKPEGEVDGQGSKFKMPKLGITMPKVKGPEIDWSLSKKDVDVTLPEAKADVKLPDVELEPSAGVEMKAPEIKAVTKDKEGSPSKFKLPTFKLPKFGVSSPSASVEVPDMDKDVKIDGADIKVPEEVLTVEIAAPSIDTEGPSIHMKTTGTEREGKGSKFKMPSLGFSVPQVKRPDIDLSLSKKDVDVTLPEANAEVKLPEAPKTDVHLGQADVSLPEGKIGVEVPELEMKPLQSEVELDSQGSKFKMPKLGMSMPKVKGPEIRFGLSKKDGDVTLPEAKAEVKVPEVELKEPSAEVDIKAPEIKVAAKGTEGSPSKFKMPTFKLPKFGVGTSSVSVKVPDVDHDVKIDGADIKIPEEVLTVDIAAPSVDIGGPSIDITTAETEHDGKESKFKMPHLGFSMPKVKGPKLDLSLSKKDIDVTLPEAKADVTLPDVDVSIPEAKMDIPEAKAEVKLPEVPKIAMEMKPPECEAEMDDHAGRFKIPKFGIKMPKVKGPEFDLSLSKKEVDVNLPEIKADVKLPDAPKIDVSLGKADVSIPEAKLEVEKPELEIKPLQTEVEGQGGKLKMPKFGMAMPKVKGPEFHLGFSKKDVDVTLPEAKADINLPDVELKEPSAKVEIKAPQIEVVAKDTEGSLSKFKMPNFGVSMPKVKGPDIHLSLSKKDTDITLPGTKTEVKLPEAPKLDVSLGKAEVSIPEAKVEVKKPEVEITPLQTDVELEGQGGKFKMPKFGITMPKVKGPEIDLRFSKKDVDVTLPDAKAEVELPEAPKISMDMKAPETEAEIDGKGSKFKGPKFGISLPKVQGPEIDVSLPKKDVHVKLPKAEVKVPEAPEIDVSLKKVDVTIPEAKMEIKKPGVEIKPLQSEGELDIQGGKFKVPKIGMSMPKVQGPEIDFSLSKKDVDVTLPEAEADVKLPDVELKEPSAKVDIKAPEIEAQLGSVKGSPSKFKMPTFKFPTFGGGTPKVTAEVPDVDKEIKIDGADMPHIDVDVPKVKAEVHLPEVEAKEISGSVVIDQQPGVEVDAKMKKPRFSLPKFSFSKPSVKAPEVDVSLPDVNVALPEGKAEVKGGEVDVKPPECEAEVDGQGSKFKMPKFDISMPKVKGPEIDWSLSKKDVDVTLPDVELKEPSAEVEVKAPEIVTKDKEVSPSKFKMPTVKLPKIGVGMPSATVEVPDMDKDVKIDGADIKVPEEVLTVEIAAPSIDTEGPSIHMKTTGSEWDGKGSKFEMPKFGITMPTLALPEIDLNLSKKDVDVTLPEAKADAKLPDVELKEPSAEVEIKAPEIKVVTKDIEGSPSKFKMPTFKLPKFGATTPQVSVEVPDVDKDVKVDGKDLKLPQTKAEVQLPDVEIKEPEGDAKLKKTRFTFPKFSFSKQSTKEPEVDVSVPDIGVSLPEGKVGVKQPEVELKPLEGDVEIDGKGNKFKMPKFDISVPKVKGPEIDLSLSKKDVDVTLPEAKADINLPDVELKEPSAKVKIKAPQIEVVAKDTEGSPSKFKMPDFSVSMPKVKGPDIHLSLSKKDTDITLPGTKTEVKLPEAPKFDTSLGKAEVSIPEAKVEVKKPEVEITPLQTDVELEGQGGKFKMPKFGITMPKVKGPEIDLSFSKKDVDVTLPEAKAEVELPEAPTISMDMKAPETEAEIDGKGSKFKGPKFGISLPKVQGPEIDVSLPKKDVHVKLPKAEVKVPEAPEIDVSLKKVDVTIPEAKMEIKKPGVEIKPLQSEGELDIQGGKFKVPKIGMSMPKVQGPEIDFSLSKKDVDVTLPEAEADVKLPDVELKEPSAEVDIKAPEIEAQLGSVKGSPSKFKMPTFKFPTFGGGTPKVTAEVPDVDKEIKIDGADMPHIDVDVPKVKAEVHLPEVEAKEISGSVVTDQQPGVEVDAKMKKPRFSLPKFSFSKPSVKAPEVDVSLPDVNVALPEGKAEVKGGEVDVKSPECEAEVDGQGSKFKMPKFDISMPKVKGPEIDWSLSKKDVDVTLPEAKADVTLPDVELKEPSAEVEIKAPEIKVVTKDKEVSPSKFKMPTFKLPKFGVSSPSATVEVPDMDKDVKIDGADIKIPEEILTVEIAAPSIDTEGPSIHMKTTGTEHEGKGSKFKMPSLGFSVPQVKQPEIDLSVSKKDVDVTLPEAKADVKLPDVELKESSAKVEIKAPEIDVQTGNVEGSPSKFKMPTFKLPKFGATTPQVSVEVPDVDKDVKVDGKDLKLPQTKAEVQLPDVEIKEPEGDAKLKKTRFTFPKFSFSKQSTNEPEVDISVPDVDVSLPEGKVEVKKPEVEGKLLEGDVEIDGQGSKFKMPKFGISLPKVKGPEIDLSLSKKDTDVTLPEAKAEIKLPDVKTKQPSAKVEIKAPEIEAQKDNVEGSPSKLKMPTFTLPKFGVSTPKVSVEVPEVEKDIKLKGATASIDAEAKGSEVEGTGSKFKMPKFGISMPKVKGPEVDLSLSKKDADVTLPEAKAEIKLPDAKIKQPSAKVEIKAPEIEAQKDNVEGSPSKLKMPTFTLPKFGVSTPKVSVEVPEVEKDIKIKGATASIVNEGPSVDVKAKGGEVEGSGSKFKMPKFGISMPKVKGPEVDLSLSKKDADVTLPEAKAEIKLPDVKTKQPSAKVEIKAAEIEAQKGNVEGSPSKLKMPTFTLPRFGVSSPKVSVEIPEVEKDIKLKGAAASIDAEGPSVDVKAKGGEVDGTGSKFKMPKFGISMPKVKGPEVDLSLSKKDADITLPEAKAEIKLPDAKTKQPSAKVEIKAPEIEAQTGNVEGSPSKLKMPTFTLPRFGVSAPKVSVEVPEVDKDIKIDGAKLEVAKEGAKVDVTAPSIDTEGVKAKGGEIEVSGSKFKMPNLGISVPKVKGPEIDLSLSKKDADVTIPEAKAEVKLPSVQVKEPEGAISVPDAPTVEAEVKRPSWTFPKFSFSKTSGKAPDVDANLETPKVDVTLPEARAEISLPDVKVQGSPGAISMEEPPAVEPDANLKKSKFSLFSFSKSSAKTPEVSAELPYVDVSLPEGEVKVKQPEMEVKAPELEAEHDGQGGKFKLPKFGIALPKAEDSNASQKADITLPEVKAEIKLPEVKSSPSVEIKASQVEAKSKDVGGSPLKVKMPAMKMPQFDVTVEAPDAAKVAETDGAKLKEDATVNIKGPSVDIKMDVSKAAITDAETPKTEADSAGLGSPSKFKLPSFKMPKLSFSKSKPEDEHVPVETECKEEQLATEVELKEESKSPKVTLTTFGEILKNIDIEFDVPKTENEEENLETSKEAKETEKPSGKPLEPKEKETETKQDTTKTPERTGWFKFPRFGLSSPSEPAKIPEKDKHKDAKSPVGETGDDELSPTCSVQSSDAFADISSAMTSEHAGPSLSSPTKVTVKYADPSTVTGLGETHSNIITSTTRTGMISVEPNLPEKITILSSGVSSSSEDTLRLESGKIHVITSNIQATPDTQHAKVLTAVQVQSSGGPPLKSETNEAASWTVEDSQSGKTTVFERHLVRETSTERSEGKETIVITKKFTHIVESSEPISGETASSIQRLRDTVHSEKMKFFDGDEE